MGSPVVAIGMLVKGFADAASYKYQAGVAAVNQKIAMQNAEFSRAVGESKAEISGIKTAQEVGKTKVAQGASGFRAGEGSGAKVIESEQMIGAAEQNTIRSNAARAAYGHEVEALNFGAQSTLYSRASSNAKVSAFIDAGSSLLGGASGTADKWMQYSSMVGG